MYIHQLIDDNRDVAETKYLLFCNKNGQSKIEQTLGRRNLSFLARGAKRMCVYELAKINIVKKESTSRLHDSVIYVFKLNLRTI